jgi:hypothetical protein
MQNGIFGLALQFRCGYTPGHMVRKQTIACKCGFTCSSNQFDAHLLGCAKYPGNHVAARHNAVRDLVQHWCRERGLATKSEPMLSGGRADLLITNASRALVVDFAVCSTLAPSGPTADETAERKNRKYTPAPGTDFCAAVFEASGGFSNSACQFIKKLSELAEDDARSLRHQISRTLAFWNGLMLAHSRPRTEPDCLVARNNKHHAEEDRNEETGRQTRNVPNDLRNQKTPRSGFAARNAFPGQEEIVREPEAIDRDSDWSGDNTTSDTGTYDDDSDFTASDDPGPEADEPHASGVYAFPAR